MELRELHTFLIENKKTLILAESCTGGALAAHFTALPDASRYFLGSIVAYSNQLKTTLLGVSQETLLQQGPVSRATATEMLHGAMKKGDADYGVATTGIAGPGGGSKDHPVGTVFIALGKRGEKPHLVECHFKGTRKEVIEETCLRAVKEFIY